MYVNLLDKDCWKIFNFVTTRLVAIQEHKLLYISGLVIPFAAAQS